MKYRIQDTPVRISVPGNKIIEEHVGRASTGNDTLSVARMVAPVGWSEPVQTPEFDEATIIVSGAMQIEIDRNELIKLQAGSSIVVNKGIPVRYSNPFDEECEYWAVCIPAFSVDTANRDQVDNQ